MGSSLGLNVSYKTFENFRWTFGYMKLGEDRTYASLPNNASVEQTVTGSELFITASYIIPLTDVMNLDLTAGPTVVSGRIDRTATTGSNFSDATGRTMGAKACASLEFFVQEEMALSFTLGYRYGKVNRMTYEDRNEEEQVIYWGNSNRHLTVDFSGLYAHLGFRYYFKPATNWVK